MATQVRMPGKLDASSIDEIIRKLKVSIPIMKQLKVDHYMRQVLLTQLIFLNSKHGQSIIVPSGLKVQTVSDQDYGKVMDAFTGVNEDNYEEVQRRLVELGLTAPPVAPNYAPVTNGNTGNPFVSSTLQPQNNKRGRVDPQQMINQLTDLISQVATLAVPD